MEPGELHQLSKVIATGLRLIGHTPYRVLGKVPVAAELVRRLPIHEHGRWPMGVVIADVYDRLRIPVKHWFTSDELEAWFSDEGYADVQVTRRVRNNETFRAAGTRR